MTEHSWEVSVFREEDTAGILAINRAEYGETALSNKAYFDWLRTASPPGVPYRVVRETATGRVVAFALSIAVRVSWCGKVIPALLSVNFVVVPEYRRQKIQTTLVAQTRDEIIKAGYRFACAYPNSRSMPALVKSHNYHLISQVPLLVRPLNIRRLTEPYVRNPLLRWGANVGWDLAGHTLWREKRPSNHGPAMQIVEDAELDEPYDRFWEQVKTKYDLMLVRDRAFLQWRFCDIPIRRYQILSARRGREIVGYVVLSPADIRGIKTGLIADFMVLAGERGDQAGLQLLQEALQRFKAAGLALAGGLALPHTQEYGLLKRARYLVAPERFAPQRFHLFVRPYSEEPPVSELTRPGAWYVSIADHDAV